MWRATFVLLGICALALACSSDGGDEPLLPTFSPSYWSLQVCTMPGPPTIALISPEADLRFQDIGDQMNITQAMTPQQIAEFRIDITIQNYRNTGEYLAAQRPPPGALPLHEALISGFAEMAAALEDKRDGFVDAETLAAVEAIYADIKAVEATVTTEAITAAGAASPEVQEALASRTGCLEQLGLLDIEPNA